MNEYHLFLYTFNAKYIFYLNIIKNNTFHLKIYLQL